MMSFEIVGLRSPERSDPGNPLSIGQGPYAKEDGQKDAIKLVAVRDYKDRAILRGLQLCARSENPGFVWFDEKKDKAKLAWIRRGRDGEVAGYCISREGRFEFSSYAKRDVFVPRFISQIFVVREQRHRLVASTMIKDFAKEGGTLPLWVESPKRETISLLQKLGFFECRARYHLWEMMFGLTCWTHKEWSDNSILPIDQSLTSSTFHEPWLWSSNGGLEMEALK